MRVDIKHKGKRLRRIAHNGQVYVQAPTKGSYTVSVYNPHSTTKLAVVTVDGINVIDGKDGSLGGPGYLVGPRQVIDIPGWKRGDTVAKFTFKAEEQSYANKTGRGLSNVGVVGVACFDEKPKPPPPPIITCRCGCGGDVHHHHHHHHGAPLLFDHTYTYSSTADSPPPADVEVNCCACGAEEDDSIDVMSFESVLPRARERSASPLRRRRHFVKEDPAKGPVDVGTGYGQEVEFHTTTVEFDREHDPCEVLTLRYATRERLQSWGVPVKKMKHPERPNAFPAEGCPAPHDWGGAMRR
jgi:hypothetical protein